MRFLFCFLALSIFCCRVSADSLTTSFVFIVGSKNVDSIPLGNGHPKTAGIVYSYATDCPVPGSAPATEEKDSQLFYCHVDERKNLKISLVGNNVGEKKITVYALGHDATGKLVENKTFTISASVVDISRAWFDECPDWDCKLYNGFYLGYEGTSVSDINEEGNVRVQYSAYAQFNTYKRFHIHVLGDLMQTSLQEQSSVSSDCVQDEEGNPCDPEVKATVAGTVGLFVPFFSKGRELSNSKNPIGMIMGPMIDYGVRKLDEEDEFVSSYYLNYRLAYRKDRYFSVGYGKAEGIPGNRVKVTGQIPIYENKLLAGFTLNFAADNKASEVGALSGDSINVYVLTRVDFSKIFTSFVD